MGDAGRDLLAARERVFGSSGPPLTEHAASRAQQPLKTANKREGDGGRQWQRRKGEGPSGQGEAKSRGDQGFFIGILIGQPIISYAARHKFITVKLAVKMNQLSGAGACVPPRNPTGNLPTKYPSKLPARTPNDPEEYDPFSTVEKDRAPS